MFATTTKTGLGQVKSQPQLDLRVHELDGLRGWAALCVVAFHMFWETFGLVHPIIRNPVTAVVLDSSVAVSIFFVLSGEALSSSYFAGRASLVTVKLAIKRYPRLAIPVLATSLIVYLLVRLGVVFNAEAAQIVNRPDWLGLAPPFDLTFFSAIKYSFVTVFAFEFPPRMIDIFLWTMRMELVGSLVVFLILAMWRMLPRPRVLLWLSYAILSVIPSATASQLSCFLIGMIFADLRWRGKLNLIHNKIGDRLLWWLMAGVGIMDGILYWRNIHVSSAWFASTLLLLVFCNKGATRLFSAPVSQWLGAISFPLYLVQFPILVSFTSWMIVIAADRRHLDLFTCLGIGLVSTCLSLVGAWLFLPVELLTKSVCNKFAGAVLSLLNMQPRKA